jgi:hypothetical protein
MAEITIAEGGMNNEDRELVRRLRLVAEQNASRINADPELKEFVEMLQRPRKAVREEDDGPEAA